VAIFRGSGAGAMKEGRDFAKRYGSGGKIGASILRP